MTLLPYELSFINPIYLSGVDKSLESKNGLIIKIEKDSITSYADVSPLPYLNFETYEDVHRECKNIDTNKIFDDINLFLKNEKENFIREKFLDFDFSKYTDLPSLKHGLSCIFSDHYRKKLGIKILGDVQFHGLILSHITKSSETDTVKRAVMLEKAGFQKVKVKIGAKEITPEALTKDNLLLKAIVSSTQKIQLRLDANRKFCLSDFPTLLQGLDLKRIEYIEEPVSKASELVHFTPATHLNIAVDENINLLKDIIFDKVTAAIVKPTILGDYHTIKKIIKTYTKRGISPVFSSCIESQVGIYQIAQLAYVFNPQEFHGLDTFDLFLENLMDLNIHRNAITLQEDIELKGPLYI